MGKAFKIEQLRKVHLKLDGLFGHVVLFDIDEHDVVEPADSVVDVFFCRCPFKLEVSSTFHFEKINKC